MYSPAIVEHGDLVTPGQGGVVSQCGFQHRLVAGNFLEKFPAFRYEFGVGSGREGVVGKNHFLACE